MPLVRHCAAYMVVVYHYELICVSLHCNLPPLYIITRLRMSEDSIKFRFIIDATARFIDTCRSQQAEILPVHDYSAQNRQSALCCMWVERERKMHI